MVWPIKSEPAQGCHVRDALEGSQRKAGDSYWSGKIRTPRARMSTHQLGIRDYGRLCAKDLGPGAGGRGTRAEGARARLLHFLLLCLGFFQDGNVGVGIFPEGEEILVGSFRFGGATRYGMRTGNSPMGQCAGSAVPHHAPVIKNFLQVRDVGIALM